MNTPVIRSTVSRSTGALLRVCLLAALVSTFAGCRKVPDLTGMTKEEATETLSGSKLKAGGITLAKRGKVPGTIVDQDPKPKSKIPADKTIALVMEPAAGETASSGNAAPEKGSGTSADPGAAVTVPNVVTKTQNDAQAALTAAGLVPGLVEVVVSDQPKGQVFYQDPPAKTEVRRGTTVNLKIASSGSVPVPNLVGKSQSEAEQALLNVRLTSAVTAVATTGAEPVGSVITQSPEPGVEIAMGQAVSLQVRKDSATIPVPSLKGVPLAEAMVTLVKLGLMPIIHRLQANELPDSPTITGQRPAPGTMVASGSPVLLVFVVHAPIADQWLRVTPQGRTVTLDRTEAVALLGGDNRRRPPTPEPVK